MTTTKTAFIFTHIGQSYSGGPLYEVLSPTGHGIGRVTRSSGKRGATWLAKPTDHVHYVRGFRSRERAAEYLQRVARESRVVSA
jgi:hypothetical protein